MEKITDWAVWLGKSVLSFGSMGTAGWVAAAAFAAFCSVGGFYLSRVAKKYRMDEANRKTDEGRSQASSDVANEGRVTEQDANAAADEIDRLAKKPPTV